MSRNWIAAVGCGAALCCAGCAADGGQEGLGGGLETLVVPDPGFTFATQRAVVLRLEPATPEVATWVEVSDAEGRRLFVGGVRGPRSLALKLPLAAEDTVTVLTGQGPGAQVQQVHLEAGQGVARL